MYGATIMATGHNAMEWDSWIEDEGVRVGQFTENASDKSQPIVIIGGLGSNPGNFQGFANRLHLETHQPVAVVDVLRADRIREIDEADMSRPFYSIADYMARMSCSMAGMEAMGVVLGKAIETARPFDIRHYTDLIDAVVDEHVTEGSWDAIGHSWGGVVVEKLLTDRSMTKQIGRAALVSTVPGVAVQFPSTEVMRIMASSDRSEERLLKVGGQLYGGDIKRDPTLVRGRHMARDVDPDAYARQIRVMPSAMPIRLTLGGIEQPVLVMGGSDDPITPFSNSLALRAMVPRAKLVSVNDGGHMFFATRSAETVRNIGSFLAEHKT